MRESRPYGSVRGDRGNPVPYRDQVVECIDKQGEGWCGLSAARVAKMVA
jgi:hypothetical protein